MHKSDGRDEAFAEALFACAVETNPEVNWRLLQTAYNAKWGRFRPGPLAFGVPEARSLKKTYGLTREQFIALRTLIYGE